MVVVAVSSMDPPLREPRTAGTRPMSLARVACTAVSRSTTVIPTTTPATPTSRRRRRPPPPATGAQGPPERGQSDRAAHDPGPCPDALAPARQEPARVYQLPRPD